MKKITTIVVALLMTLTSFSQKIYNVYKTEIYEWKSESWSLSSENRNIEIPVYMYKRFIHILAKDNAYLLIDDESVDISGKNFKGVSYNAYEFSTETKCVIHLVDFKQGESMMSITWFKEGINIRYYIR